MSTDLELARAHFQCAGDLLATLATLEDGPVRAALLAEARISYGAGVRRLNREAIPSDEVLSAELRGTERRLRAILEAEEDDHTTRYLMRREVGQMQN